MFRQLIAVLVVALCVGAGVTTARAQYQSGFSDTFVWDGELVSVDHGTGMFTIKARLLTDAAKEVTRFHAGDRVVLTWSAYDKYADAIRQISRHDANQKVVDVFTLPVELVSPELQNNYVTFKFRAPAAVDTVKAVKPGEWVTVTVKKGSAAGSQSIVAVAPYVKSTATT